MSPELKLDFVEVTLCGNASLLIHMTVSPGLTSSTLGENCIASITTACVFECANTAGSDAALSKMKAASNATRLKMLSLCGFNKAGILLLK